MTPSTQSNTLASHSVAGRTSLGLPARNRSLSSHWILSLFLAATLSACGNQGGDESQDDQDSPDKTQVTDGGGVPHSRGQPVSNNPSTDTGSNVHFLTGVPVETFIEGGRSIPQRLKAKRLVLTFKSNVTGALFECKFESVGDSGAYSRSSDFSPCSRGGSRRR